MDITLPKPLEKHTVKELREALSQRNLPSSGTKPVLVDRLRGDLDSQTWATPGGEPVEEPDRQLAEGPICDTSGEEEEGMGWQRGDSVLEEEGGWGSPEWELMNIPDHWRPMPVLVMRGVPDGKRDAEVREFLEGEVGLSVVSAVEGEEEKVWYVRLAPMELPWTMGEGVKVAVKEEGEMCGLEGGEENVGEGCGVGGKWNEEGEKGEVEVEDSEVAETGDERPLEDGTRDGDAWKRAKFVAAQLMEKKLCMDGKGISVEAPELRTTIFVCNLPPVLHEDENFRATMAQFGSTERCFVMHDREGRCKDYAFVEFSLPSSADNAKQVLDKQASEGFERLFALKGRKVDTQSSLLASVTASPSGNCQEKPSVELEGALPLQKVENGDDPALDDICVAREDTIDKKHGINEIQREVTEGDRPAAVSCVVPDGCTEEIEEKELCEDDIKIGLKQEEYVEEALRCDVPVPVERTANVSQLPSGDASPLSSTTQHQNSVLVEREVKEKVIRTEWCWTNTIESLFSKTLYVSNLLSSVSRDSPELKEVFEAFGPVQNWNVLKSKVTGYGKTYAFVEYYTSEHAQAAFQTWDQKSHPMLGYLLISFVNPSKLSQLDKRRRAVARRPFSFPSPPARGTGPRYQLPSGKNVRPVICQSPAGLSARTGSSPLSQPLAHPHQNVTVAQVIVQHQIAARLQLQHMQQIYQQQTAQLHAQYQAQIRSIQAQQRKLEEHAIAHKRAQVALATVQQQQQQQQQLQQQQFVSARLGGHHISGYKGGMHGRLGVGHSRLTTGAHALGQSSMGSGLNGQQSYAYGIAQQPQVPQPQQVQQQVLQTQQAYGQNYYGTGYGQQQQQVAQPAYGQASFQPYASGSSPDQIYGQNVASGYATQGGSVYNQPVSHNAHVSTSLYGAQSGTGAATYAALQAGGYSNQPGAGGYGAQPCTSYNGQTASSYGGQSGIGYGNAAGAVGAGYGTQQLASSTHAHNNSQYGQGTYPQAGGSYAQATGMHSQNPSGYAGQAAFNQAVQPHPAYLQPQQQQQQSAYGQTVYGQNSLPQIGQGAQQVVALAGQKRDAGYVYQQPGYEYTQLQEQEHAADYPNKRSRY